MVTTAVPAEPWERGDTHTGREDCETCQSSAQTDSHRGVRGSEGSRVRTVKREMNWRRSKHAAAYSLWWGSSLGTMTACTPAVSCRSGTCAGDGQSEPRSRRPTSKRVCGMQSRAHHFLPEPGEPVVTGRLRGRDFALGACRLAGSGGRRSTLRHLRLPAGRLSTNKACKEKEGCSLRRGGPSPRMLPAASRQFHHHQCRG